MTLRAGWSVLAATTTGIVVLAAVLTVPDLLRRTEPDTAPRAPECIARATAPAEEIGVQDARWVRFCPLAAEGAAMRVRHPAGVVTGDLAAATADTLWQTQEGRRVCAVDGGPTAGPTRRFRIEVGLADGRVAELVGDTGCSTRDLTIFSQLETTLLMDAASQQAAAAPPDPVRCPRRLTTAATNADGSSAEQLVDDAEHPWQSTVPLLPMPATVADVCSYAGTGAHRDLVGRWRVDPGTADALRALATVGYSDGRTDCARDPGATSYVVALGDPTGTTRTLAIDPTRCGTVHAALGLPATDTYLGLASPRLVRAVARSRP